MAVPTTTASAPCCRACLACSPLQMPPSQIRAVPAGSCSLRGLLPGGCFGVAEQGGAHPAATQLGRPQAVLQGIHIRHQGSAQLCVGAMYQGTQAVAARAPALGGIDRHHIGAGAPHRPDLLPAGGDVHRAAREGALPQADDQGLGAAAAHRADVLGTLQAHTGGAVAQRGFRHGGDQLGIAQRRALRRLHRHDQAGGSSQFKRHGLQEARGRSRPSCSASGNHDRSAASEGGAGAGVELSRRGGTSENGRSCSGSAPWATVS